MKKRIAIINSVYKFGSTGRICFEMANYFNKSGFDTKVFYGRKKQKKDDIGKKFSSAIGVLIHAVLARLFDNDSFHSFFSTKRLITALRRFNPDFIILHNLHGYYINFKLLMEFLIISDIDIMYVFHDCWPFTGHCAHFDYVGCEKFKTCCFNCVNKKEYPKSYWIDNSKKNYLVKKEFLTSLKNVDIICPSNWMRDVVSDSFLNDKNIVVINNGIDTNVFHKKENDLKDKLGLSEFRIILCVASVWNARKGIGDIIKLSKMLKKNEKIIIIGKITDRVEFDDSVLRINHTDSIHELADYYNLADIFFNPTYEDNYPTVNLEALCCHLPVVCYKTGGAFEEIDPIFVVNRGDINGAYNIIRSFFDAKIKYSFSSQKNFDKSETYKKYMEIIKNKI